MAAVTAAEAEAASGVVHACYNKSTHVLKYSKKASCASGTKAVSWSKQGTPGHQGAKGAQGAQGGTGPAVGWANEQFSVDRFFSSGSPAVAASFTPASAGYFAVRGFADIYPDVSSRRYHCWDQGGTGGGNSTPFDSAWAIHHDEITFAIPTGGIITAGPTKPVYEMCSGDSGYVYSTAEVTGIHLATAHATTASKSRSRLGATRRAPSAAKNKFNKTK
jgi:hypothetical protein